MILVILFISDRVFSVTLSAGYTSRLRQIITFMSESFIHSFNRWIQNSDSFRTQPISEWVIDMFIQKIHLDKWLYGFRIFMLAYYFLCKKCLFYMVLTVKAESIHCLYEWVIES